jgi:hypothetical protein
MEVLMNGNLPRQPPRSLGLFSRRLLHLYENFAAVLGGPVASAGLRRQAGRLGGQPAGSRLSEAIR